MRYKADINIQCVVEFEDDGEHLLEDQALDALQEQFPFYQSNDVFDGVEIVGKVQALPA